MAQLAHDASLHADDHHGDEHEHPGELTYIKVAILLAIITVIEVAIYYVEWMHDSGALVPSLIVLSAIKFFFVVSFFMHLKFDDKLLTYTFVGGLAFGAALVLSFMALFHYHALDYAADFIRLAVH